MYKSKQKKIRMIFQTKLFEKCEKKTTEKFVNTNLNILIKYNNMQERENNA